MDRTESVSKGCFVFTNDFQTKSKQRRREKSKSLKSLRNDFSSEKWCKSYAETWNQTKEKMEKLNTAIYDNVLKNLLEYVKNCYTSTSDFYDEIIPCASLLIGINQPDHTVLFAALKDQLQCGITPHVATIYSQDSSSVKNLIENTVTQFVNASSYDSDSEDEDGMRQEKRLKKNQCNMPNLKSWYNKLYEDKTMDSTNYLVVIIPDFECFNSEVLQDFITILSGYTPNLPIVLIFGVATSVMALHKSLPYNVTSKLYIKVFQSHTSSEYLNKILENIIFSEECPFHLAGKPFKLLMDVFLFYDFSVTGFFQSFKYCMMEHFYGSNIKSLCCPRNLIEERISNLSDKDVESLRRLPSFRPYVESQQAASRISLLLDNEYLKIKAAKLLRKIHDYMFNFHKFLKVLLVFVSDLPKAPLGKQLRELYGICISSPIVENEEYKRCLTYLNFQSKDEMMAAIDKCFVILNYGTEDKKHVMSTPKKSKKNPATSHLQAVLSAREKLLIFKMNLQNASLQQINVATPSTEDASEEMQILDRRGLKEKLLKASMKDKTQSEFEVVRTEFFKFLTEEVFGVHLVPPTSLTFHELYFFDDILKVKKHIVGSPRSSIHTALNNPVTYLQCKCCELPNEEAIVPSLPDICIAYKLHLECGKLINLYDWLQAFLTVVDPQEYDENSQEEERREVDPQLQARFTRAVAELQFLGFIKSSKKKTDHVSRMTF